MSVQVWTFFHIFNFGLYKSQFGLGQVQQAIFTLPEAAFPLSQTEWQPPQIDVCCIIYFHGRSNFFLEEMALFI